MNLYAEITGNILFGLVVIRAMDIFFEKRRTPLLITTFSYLFCLVLTSLQLLWLDSVTPIIFVILNILVSMTALFIISLNYESSMIKRLAAISCMNFLFSAVNQILNLLPFSYVIDLVDIKVLPLIGKIPIYIAVSLFRRRFKNIKKSTNDLPMFWVPVLVITATINVVEIFNALNLQQISDFLITTILFITSFISFYLYDTLSTAYEDKLKSAVYSQEREYYLSQCQIMQDSVERMKSFKHDVKSHLAALRDFTDNKATMDYLDSLLGDIGDNEIYSDTGNLAFDSIINYKLRNAKEDNIKLDIRMFIPPVLNIEVTDVVTILGNLLDNAIDAVAKTDEKMIKLNVKFDKGGLFIMIDNLYSGEVKYLDEKAREDKQLASLKSGAEHGYGLKNIRQSIEKYNGYMKITHTNNIFSTVVFLYIDDK